MTEDSGGGDPVEDVRRVAGVGLGSILLWWGGFLVSPLSARAPAIQPVDRALAQVDTRLANLEEAILGRRLPPPRLVSTTGRRGAVRAVCARINARLARMERVVFRQRVPVPRTVARTGAITRSPDQRMLVDLDARLARLELAIVGVASPSPHTSSFSGRLYRNPVERILASLNARLANMESVIYRRRPAAKTGRG